MGIGVWSTLTVSLAPDPEMREGLRQHMGRGAEYRYLPLLDAISIVLIPIPLAMDYFRIDI